MKMETVLAAKGPRVVTIEARQPVREAIRVLAHENVGALVVLGSDGRPCGILSERDLIRALAGGEILERRVTELMTTDVVYGSPEDDVESVLRSMTARHFRHLPVLEGGALVGLVTTGDLVQAQLEQYQGEVATLETRLMES